MNDNRDNEIKQYEMSADVDIEKLDYRNGRLIALIDGIWHIVPEKQREIEIDKALGNI